MPRATYRRLTDEQIREFLARGFLLLRSSLPESYHQRIFDRTHALATGPGHFGNNLLPLIPELDRFFEEPVVRGALTSILGSQYLMHPHRALHTNPPGSDQQSFHKDSYWGYTRRVRNHRPWWVMVMYFPQDTPLGVGPTAVMDGSQHIYQRPETFCDEAPATGPAGTFLLIHYDIWHRKMLNTEAADRYMFKFEFTRLAPPDTGSGRPWRTPKRRPALDLSPVWQSNWAWLQGQTPTQAARGRLDDWLGHMESGDEHNGIVAAYEASAFGAAAVSPLLSMLEHNPAPADNTRYYADNGANWQADAGIRNATHALVNIGKPALRGLMRTLADGNPRARKHAAFALGEISTGSRASERALREALHDHELQVRIAATEALSIKPASTTVVNGLIEALRDPESEVRFDAALGLVRAAAQDSGKLTRAIAPLGDALDDSNRYVSAHAVDALERIASPAALRLLLPFLRTARWCAHTDNARPF